MPFCLFFRNFMMIVDYDSVCNTQIIVYCNRSSSLALYVILLTIKYNLKCLKFVLKGNFVMNTET